MALAQALTVAIFLGMLGVITLGKVERYIPSLIGAALVLVVVFLIVLHDSGLARSVLNLGRLAETEFWLPHEGGTASRGVNWQTIVFITGMMIMVGGLAEVGFFRWMCLLVTKLVRYKIAPILVSFMLLSGFLSMFIDSITVMLFLASVTVEIGHLLKFDPVPLIIAEIFAANTGGAATMSGDPPNIIIGTSLGYTFTDFIVGTGPIAWAGMVVAIAYFYVVLRKHLAATQSESAAGSRTTYPQPREAIADNTLFILHTGVFILVIVLLVAHAYIGISVALIGVIAATLTLMATRKDEARILRRVDWRTLLFFIGLFVCVGGLEATGVQQLMAGGIREVSGGALTSVLPIILWFSAFVSAIVDNIPFAATMVPVIRELAEMPGLALAPMAFALALGTDIGGNATPIGASANVVATAVSRREGYPIGWGRYLKYAVPPTLLVIALCNVLLCLRY